jgi:uncharacterized membrane protein YgcG
MFGKVKDPTIKDMSKKKEKSQVLQTEQIVRVRVPRRYSFALLLVALIALAGIGFGIYSYVTMPSQIAKYVSKHKSELKGDKGSTGDVGPPGMDGINGSSGNSGSSLHCTTYGMNNQFTDCY